MIKHPLFSQPPNRMVVSLLERRCALGRQLTELLDLTPEVKAEATLISAAITATESQLLAHGMDFDKMFRETRVRLN